MPRGKKTDRTVATSRADDERALAMLRMRDRKISASKIAAQFGVTRSVVLGIFHRIDHDLARSEAA